MSAKEPYSFWCRYCKKDHAGECPPAKLAFEDAEGMSRGWPIVGSRWDEMRRSTDPLTGEISWRDGFVWCRVKALNTVDGTVTCEIPGVGDAVYDRLCWGNIGYRKVHGRGSWLMRMKLRSVS